MQRPRTAPGEIPINADEIAHVAHLRRKHYGVVRQPQLFRGERRLHGAFHDGVQKDVLRCFGVFGRAVRIHHASQKFFVDAAAVHTDAHGLFVLDGQIHHRRKVGVVAGALTDVAGIDAIFGKRLSAVRIVSKELMPVVVKVPHQRYAAPGGVKFFTNLRNGFCRRRRVDREAHEFTARRRQFRHLPHRRFDVFRSGVRHGLHDDGVVAAHPHFTTAVRNPHGGGQAAFFINRRHRVFSLPRLRQKVAGLIFLLRQTDSAARLILYFPRELSAGGGDVVPARLAHGGDDARAV